MASHATSLQDKMMRLLALFYGFCSLFSSSSFPCFIDWEVLAPRFCFVCVSGWLTDFTLL